MTALLDPNPKYGIDEALTFRQVSRSVGKKRGFECGYPK